MALAAMLTIKPTLAIGSYAPRAALAVRARRPRMSCAAARTGHGAGDDRAAELQRAAGTRRRGAAGRRQAPRHPLHARRRIPDLRGEHPRPAGEALSKYADSPVLVVNYRMIPKHSVGMALDDCYDAYKWLRLKGYEPEQIVLAGDSAGGYLALALAERLQREGLAGETPAAIVTMSPLFEIDNESRANHPNIRSDAMFPPKAFTALVELVEGGRRAQRRRRQARGDLRAARPHRARPAAHVDPCVRVRGAAERRPQGRAHAGRRGRAGRGAGVARSDARVPDRRARGEGGNEVAATGRRLHPRGHLVTVSAA